MKAGEVNLSAASAKASSISAGMREQVGRMRDRDARGRRTMARLHAALLSLIEQQAFERITVDDITKRAAVSRSTFYRHYADQEALIEEIARAEITHVASLSIPLVDRANSLSICRSVVAYVGEHRRLWSVLLTGGAAGVMRHKFIELATPEPGTARATPANGIPVDLSAAWGVAASVEVLMWWLKNPERATVDEVAHYMDRLAVRPAFEQSPKS